MSKFTFKVAESFRDHSAVMHKDIDFTDVEAVQWYADDVFDLIWRISDDEAKFILETLQRVHERHLNGEGIDWFYDFKKPLLEY